MGNAPPTTAKTQQSCASRAEAEWQAILTENKATYPGLLEETSIENDGDTELSFCALLSTLAYKVKSKEGLRRALLHHMGLVGQGDDFAARIHHLDVRPEDTHDKPWDHKVLCVVHDQTLFLAWKGTADMMDAVKDLCAVPVRTSLWSAAFPSIRAHTGIVSTLDDRFVSSFGGIVQLLEDFSIERVVFTGHSLGGGLAQLALMAVYGQQALGYPLWATVRNNVATILERVVFSAQAFASPMVFSYSENALNEEESSVAKRFRENCRVFVYGSDLIPRCPGNVDYFMKAAREVAKSLVGQSAGRSLAESSKASRLVVHGLAYGLVGPMGFVYLLASKTGAEQIGSMSGGWSFAKLEDAIRGDQALMAALESYRHMAHLVYVSASADNHSQTSISYEDFMAMPLQTCSGEELLQMHSVLPRCIGPYMIARRKALLDSEDHTTQQ